MQEKTSELDHNLFDRTQKRPASKEKYKNIILKVLHFYLGLLMF